MTTQIDGYRSPATEGLRLEVPGPVTSESVDHYVALGHRLRSQAMGNWVQSLLKALSSGSRRRGDQPNEADRFVDGALSANRDRASREA